MSPTVYEKLVHVNYGPNARPNGRQLVADFAEYVEPAARVHSLALHGPGVAAGLEVTAGADHATLKVAAGVAIARSGQVIVLATHGAGLLGDAPPLTEIAVPVLIPAANLISLAGATVVVTIEAKETHRLVPPLPDGSQPFPDGKLEQTPWVRLVRASSYKPGPDQVVLAVAYVGGDGKVTRVASAAPGVPAERERLGTAVGELWIERSAADSASDTAAGAIVPLAAAEGLEIRAKITALTGELLIAGHLNGRETAKDGILLDDLAKRVQLLEQRL